MDGEKLIRSFSVNFELEQSRSLPRPNYLAGEQPVWYGLGTGNKNQTGTKGRR